MFKVMNTKVTSKYRITIPKEVRITLGLKPGSKVSVFANEGVVCLVPILKDNDKTELDKKDSSKTLYQKV